MRFLLATVFVAGCSFEHGRLDVQPDPGGGGHGNGADAAAAPRTCKVTDPALRLCIEFEDRVFSPVVYDASVFQMIGTASNLSEASRNGTPAAKNWYGSIILAETTALDIPTKITLEMWIRIKWQDYGLLVSNDGQYKMTLEGDRHACWIGSTRVTSTQKITFDTWTHVACTFDGERITSYVNGSSPGCVYAAQTISTTPTDGTRIAVSYGGELDDIHVYDRALAVGELCSRADTSGCTSACTDGGG